jgi:hypothetical protein
MPLHGDEVRRLYNFACFGKPFAYSRHDPLVMQSAEKSALISDPLQPFVQLNSGFLVLPAKKHSNATRVFPP